MCLTALLAVGVLFANSGIHAIEKTKSNCDHLLSIREHVMRAYSLKPRAEDQCSDGFHRAAVRMYVRRITPDQQDAFLKGAIGSIVRMDNRIAVGLLETCAALSTSQLENIIVWSGLQVNSAIYRDPLTGKAVTLHTQHSPAFSVKSHINDPETGRRMDLKSCYPLPKWINKFFREFASGMVLIEPSEEANSTRNLFIALSGGIAGVLPAPEVFGANPFFLNYMRRNQSYQTAVLPGVDVRVERDQTANDSAVEAANFSYQGKEDKYDCYGASNSSGRDENPLIMLILFYLVVALVAFHFL